MPPPWKTFPSSVVWDTILDFHQLFDLSHLHWLLFIVLTSKFWNTLKSESHSVVSNSAIPWTVACQGPLSMGILRQEYWSGWPCPPPGDLPTGIEPRSPTLQADSLHSEPPGKPKNTWVSSLSLLQGIFLTQESNQGLLHCRGILYQLSYQGSPIGGI